MNTKFLYCKYDNLKKFIHNGAPIRFTDINKFIKLENEKIRDDESKKTFDYTPQHGVLEVDGIKIDFVDLQLSYLTRRAHVLCLSNDGNSEELFNHFKSDTCIEIDVDLLIKMVKDKSKIIDEKIEVIGKNVEYYRSGSKIIIDGRELVFRKNYEKFHTENEYRIAIFYPYDDETRYKLENNDYAKLFGDNNYIEIGIKDKIGMRRIIVEARRKDGSIIR